MSKLSEALEAKKLAQESQPYQPKLKVGEIIRIKKLGSYWSNSPELVGELARVVVPDECLHPNGCLIAQLIFLNKELRLPSSLLYSGVWIEFTYKKVPKYAVAHFSMEKEEES